MAWVDLAKIYDIALYEWMISSVCNSSYTTDSGITENETGLPIW